MLSVILPAYNEEKMIQTAAETIRSILDAAEIPFELVFINDGSKDRTWDEICLAREKDPRVCGVCFSRNFGKEAAMFAGLEKARGDCCAVLDCDLQHPPEKLVEMYRLWEQGYEVVEGIKEDRGEETGLHRFAANRFYGLISRATGMDMSSSSDFKLLDRKVVDALNRMPERNGAGHGRRDAFDRFVRAEYGRNDRQIVAHADSAVGAPVTHEFHLTPSPCRSPCCDCGSMCQRGRPSACSRSLHDI